jgi:hypothetical protein
VPGGGPGVVRTGCLREGGNDVGEVVASISDAVAVGRACSALLGVLVVLSRCCEWFGLFVRYISFLQWTTRVTGGFRYVLVRLLSAGAEYASRPTGGSVGFSCRVGVDFVGRRSIDGCPNVCCEVAAYSSCGAVFSWHVLAGRSTSQLAHLPGEQGWFHVQFVGQLGCGHEFPPVRTEIITEVIHNECQWFGQFGEPLRTPVLGLDSGVGAECLDHAGRVDHL